jgi:photosystem II stability/assembly factor-like uncharacterized protein
MNAQCTVPPTHRARAAVLLVLVAMLLVAPGAGAARTGCAGVEVRGAWREIASPVPARAFAVDGTGHVFVAGPDTIMSSRDGGCTWETRLALPGTPSAELPFYDEHFTAMTMSGDVLLAALTGPHVIVSRDAGSTWRRADDGLDLPGDPVGLYAALSGGVVYLLVRQAVTDQALPAAGLPEQGVSALATVLYRSDDGARTWTRTGDPGLAYTGPHGSDVEGARSPGAVWDLAIDPLDPDHLLAAARGGVFRSVTGGDRWSPVVFAPELEARTVSLAHPPDGSAAAVAVDPRSGTLYGTRDVASDRWTSRRYPQLRTEQMLSYPNAAPWAWSSFGVHPRDVAFSGPKGVFRWSGGGLADVTPPGLGGPEDSAADLQLLPGPHGPVLWARLLDGSALVAEVPPAAAPIAARRGPSDPTVTIPVTDRGFDRIAVPEVDPGGVELVPDTRRVALDPGESATVAYGARLEPRPTPVDVYFLLDTTASMSDAIRALTEGMQDIVVRLASSRIELHAGVGAFRTYPRESDRIVENYPYRRVRRIGPVDEGLLRGLYELEGRGSSGSNLTALLQSITGAGQDVLPLGPSKADVPPGHEAGFRGAALKVVFHFADTWFGTPERGDPNGNYAPGTWPGPGFEPAIAALREESVHHLGIAMQPSAGGTVLTKADVAEDLRLLSRSTSSLAGARGADCDGDGEPDLRPGEPLVCSLDREAGAGRLTSVVAGLVEALEDRGQVELVEIGDSGRVRAIAPEVYPSVDLRGSHRLGFDVTVACGVADAGTRRTVSLGLRVASDVAATAEIDVTCNELSTTTRPAPARPRPQLALIPPIPVPPPPHTVPGLGPGSVTAPAPVQAPAPAQAPGGQPQGALMAQRREQPQLAFVAAAQQVRAQTQMEHAMVRTRARDPLGAAKTWTAVGALSIVWAWGIATAVATSLRRARR